MVYISNSFSLGMLAPGTSANTRRLTVRDALDVLLPPVTPDGQSIGQPAISCIGHADTATLINRVLGATCDPADFLFPFCRVSVTLQKGDMLVVGQYIGPRLPEGATVLPDGAQIEFFLVSVYADGYVEDLIAYRKDGRKAVYNSIYHQDGRAIDDFAKKYHPEILESLDD